METTTGEAPAKRRRIEGHEKTQIPQETMLEVLRWLDRFDLDGTQITTRRMRSLAENNQMPLRKVCRVNYVGQVRGVFEPQKRNMLCIRLEEDSWDDPAPVELPIETDTDAHKAAAYLSSCFVRDFNVYGHRDALPKNAIITAPELIRVLDLRHCNFDKAEEDTLSETLNGSTFQRLLLQYSSVPVWQIDDKRLESLRLRGCNEFRVCPDIMELLDDAVKNKVTEEGILSYCFTLDAGLPVPESRILAFSRATITPAFFKKVVQASKNSQLTCDIELCLECLRFDVSNLDVGVLPSASQEYDPVDEEHSQHVRYNVADHGNGIRLLIHFKSTNGEYWDVTVRHGKKEHDEFFEPPEEDDEDNEEQ